MVDRSLITRVHEVIPLAEYQRKIARGKPLIIKLGIDPTTPDLHLGHAVVLDQLRKFQDAGHTIIFLIGNFTAQIGDPTGKSKTRPPLTTQEVEQNAQTYLAQAGKIIDTNKVRVAYNADWLATLKFDDLLKLCSKVTVARLIEREDFANRLATQQPVGMHELLYPLMQGYDSVALKADIEIGGTDQTFNMLMGRHLQEHYGQEPQVVITMPLLEGTDGVHKMSKSLGNAIGLTEQADQAYGKLMSVPDALVSRYLSLLADYSSDKINTLIANTRNGKLSAIDFKKHMAHVVIQKFWSPQEADQAQQTFSDLHQKRDYGAAPEFKLPPGFANPVWIVDLLKTIGATKTSSDARRLLEAGAVTIDQECIKDFKAMIMWQPGQIIRAGKLHIYKLA